jgi:protein-tyrosine phosphatase
MKSILFICTGNIFRSMTAEYVLKAALEERPELTYRVSSAGVEARPQMMAAFIKDQLLKRGIDPAGHRQRKLTAEILAEANLAVAMGFDHRAYVRETFKQDVPLFNQVCFGREQPILDTWEAVPDWQTNPLASQTYALQVVDYICEAMPAFIENIERFLVGQT